MPAVMPSNGGPDSHAPAAADHGPRLLGADDADGRRPSGGGVREQERAGEMLVLDEREGPGGGGEGGGGNHREGQAVRNGESNFFFEGVEKLLEVWFTNKSGDVENCDLRDIPRLVVLNDPKYFLS